MEMKASITPHPKFKEEVNKETGKHVEESDIEILNDIAIGTLHQRYDNWSDEKFGVAFFWQQNRNQKVCARADGWTPTIDLKTNMVAEPQRLEFRGQPGTVYLNGDKEMIITKSIDALPGLSGSPLMLVHPATMNPEFEENVAKRDNRIQERKANEVGHYMTLSTFFFVFFLDITSQLLLFVTLYTAGTYN